MPQIPSRVSQATIDPLETRTRWITVSLVPETATYRVFPSGASAPSPPTETYEGPAPGAAAATTREARKARTVRAAIRRCTAIPPVRGTQLLRPPREKGSLGRGRLWAKCHTPGAVPGTTQTPVPWPNETSRRRKRSYDALCSCGRTGTALVQCLAPCKRRAVENAWLCRSDLQQEGVALAAAGADRGEAEAAAVSAQLVHHRADDASAGCADRVTERDCAAVHVHDLLVRAEEPRRVERYGRKRLVDLHALDIPDRLARLLERAVARTGRRAREIREVVGDVCLREDRREDLEATPLRERLRGDDHAR